MGKKDKGGGNLGKALIRDRFGTGKARRNKNEPSMVRLHAVNLFVEMSHVSVLMHCTLEFQGIS